MTSPLLVTLAAIAIAAGGTTETRIISNEPIYQQWVKEAQAPTPPGEVLVFNAQCPYIKAYACAAGREIYSPIKFPDNPEFSRQLFYHELGHVAATVFVRWPYRQSFMRLIGTDNWRPASTEEFAELYAICAGGQQATRTRLFRRDVTREQIDAGCRLIDRAYRSKPTRVKRRSIRQRFWW